MCTYIYIYIYIRLVCVYIYTHISVMCVQIIYIYIYIYTHTCKALRSIRRSRTAGFGGFDSCIFSVSRGGVPRSTGDFPEIESQWSNFEDPQSENLRF